MRMADPILMELEEEAKTTRRLLDVPIPSGYGPTADEDPFG